MEAVVKQLFLRIVSILAFFFVLFVLASIGLPGLNGFVSEFLTILGAFTSDYLGIWFGSFAALGIILGAVYMLHMTARVIFGPLKTPVLAGEGHGDGHHDVPGDINGREIAILIPLAIAVVWLGVYPAPLLRAMDRPVNDMRLVLTETPSANAAVALADKTNHLELKKSAAVALP